MIKNNIYSFKATITECEEKSMIVKPDENSRLKVLEYKILVSVCTALE